jgi:class 3 adenylate cyclase
VLDVVFTTFDGFVAELGLEKIKTVGDAYMVASGVPEPPPDQAAAIAALAIRIRDHCAANEFEGRPITVRIGINSGPVVAESSEPTSSPMTCGATSSTRRAGWSQRACPDLSI